MEKDQPWVKFLEAKFFYNSNPFDPTRNYELSWIWTSIQKGMNIIKGNYIWQVKNGVNTNIWEDNQIPNTNRLNKPRDRDDNLPQKVQELINNEGHRDTEKLDDLFSPDIKEKILAITPNKEDRDKIRWDHHQSGDFSEKNIYNFLINGTSENENNIEFPWKKLWKLQTLPRIRLFIQKLIQKALPTSSRLATHNSEVSPECQMCNNQAMETENHLFRTCPFTRAVWFGCSLEAVNSRVNTNVISKWVEFWIDDKNFSQFSEQIAIILWFIWKNDARLFSGKPFRIPPT